MDPHKLIAKVLRYFYTKSMDMEWLKRRRRLTMKYGKISVEAKVTKKKKSKA